MEILLLKSSACLLALLAFYKLALEPLSIHKFKRVYLLAAVIIAVIIPFITFIKYVDPTFNFGAFDPNSPMSPPYFPADLSTVIETEPTNYLPTILWIIYGLGTSLFLVRFCINLFQMHSKITKHTTVKNKQFVNVLIEKLEVPHTFFNFIFLNKTRFENNQIPLEVLLHEQTHARQKHSLDILIIEVLQVVFWFNPLLYWLKKEIKLNHEFLADQEVIKKGVDTKTYQTILLQFSSNQDELALVNAINYSSIKKRFTLMKTQTSKQAVWLRSLLLLPLLAILLFSFSQTKEIEKESTPKMEIEKNNAPTKLIENEKENSLNDALKNSVEKIQENYSTTPILEINQNPLRLKLNDEKTSYNSLKSDFIKITNNNKSNLKINANGGISMEIINKIHSILGENLDKIRISQGTHLVGIENEKTIKPKIVYNPELNNTKASIPVFGNAICDDCTLTVNKEFAKYSILSTNKNEKITEFKVKFLKKPTLTIKGNKFNKKALEYLEEVSDGEVLIFDISTLNGYVKSTIGLRFKEENYQNPTLTVNGIECDGCLLNLSIDGIKNLILGTTTKNDILNFKLKIPGIKTQYNIGNILNDETKQYVSRVKKGVIIQLLDIKAEGSKIKPVIIKVVDKNDENYSVSPKVKKGKDSSLPAPPPPAPSNSDKNTGFIEINGQTHFYAINAGKTKYYNRWGIEVDKQGNKLSTQQTDGSKIVPGHKITKVYKDGKVVSEFAKTWEDDDLNIPPPPPPPPATNTEYNDRRPKMEAKRNEIMAKRQEKLEELEEKRASSRKTRQAQLEERKNTLKQRREQIKNNPPPPPAPISTSDHIIKMKKKGATFYYNGKTITSDRALELVKKNPELNMSSNTNNGVATVHLSEKPIKTVNGKIVKE